MENPYTRENKEKSKYLWETPPNKGLSPKSINRNTKTKITPRSTKQHKQNPQVSSQLPQKQLLPPTFRCSHTTAEHQLKNIYHNQQPLKNSREKTQTPSLVLLSTFTQNTTHKQPQKSTKNPCTITKTTTNTTTKNNTITTTVTKTIIDHHKNHH